ncbi:MAG: antibiotic biosynthesis monooxygenase [Chloroflexota bacterium]
MYIVLVHVRVKPEYIDSFCQASIENANNSYKEQGIARFDVIQQQDDPSRFILVEVYRDTNASLAHKETEHYKKWRNTVEIMMAEPRSGMKYTNVFPEELGWE